MADFSLKGVNKPKDPENMTDMEKKHTPMIHVPEEIKPGEPFSVKVVVGELLAHPNELSHYINWIALYDEQYTFLGMVTLAPVVSHPRVRFTVTLDEPTTLRAFAFCNLHGLWQGKREVKF
jgi:superoxide reductase